MKLIRNWRASVIIVGICLFTGGLLMLTNAASSNPFAVSGSLPSLNQTVPSLQAGLSNFANGTQNSVALLANNSWFVSRDLQTGDLGMSALPDINSRVAASNELSNSLGTKQSALVSLDVTRQDDSVSRSSGYVVERPDGSFVIQTAGHSLYDPAGMPPKYVIISAPTGPLQGSATIVDPVVVGGSAGMGTATDTATLIYTSTTPISGVNPFSISTSTTIDIGERVVISGYPGYDFTNAKSLTSIQGTFAGYDAFGQMKILADSGQMIATDGLSGAPIIRESDGSVVGTFVSRPTIFSQSVTIAGRTIADGDSEDNYLNGTSLSANSNSNNLTANLGGQFPPDGLFNSVDGRYSSKALWAPQLMVYSAGGDYAVSAGGFTDTVSNLYGYQTSLFLQTIDSYSTALASGGAPSTDLSVSITAAQAYQKSYSDALTQISPNSVMVPIDSAGAAIGAGQSWNAPVWSALGLPLPNDSVHPPLASGIPGFETALSYFLYSGASSYGTPTDTGGTGAVPLSVPAAILGTTVRSNSAPACFVQVDLNCPSQAATGAGSPKARQTLLSSDDVQQNAANCALFAQMMKTECGLRSPIVSVFYAHLNAPSSAKVNYAITADPTVFTRKDLSAAFNSYIGSFNFASGNTSQFNALATFASPTNTATSMTIAMTCAATNGWGTGPYQGNIYGTGASDVYGSSTTYASKCGFTAVCGDALSMAACGNNVSCVRATFNPFHPTALLIIKNPTQYGQLCTTSDAQSELEEILAQATTDGLSFQNYAAQPAQGGGFTAFAGMPLLNQVDPWVQGIFIDKFGVNVPTSPGICAATSTTMMALGLKANSPYSLTGTVFDSLNPMQTTNVRGAMKQYGDFAVHIEQMAETLGLLDVVAVAGHRLSTPDNWAEAADVYEVANDSGSWFPTASDPFGYFQSGWWDPFGKSRFIGSKTKSIFIGIPGFSYRYIVGNTNSIIGNSSLAWFNHGGKEISNIAQQNIKSLIASGNGVTLAVWSPNYFIPGGWNSTSQETSGHALAVQGVSGNDLIIFDPWSRVYHVRFGQMNFTIYPDALNAYSTANYVLPAIFNVGGDIGYLGQSFTDANSQPWYATFADGTTASGKTTYAYTTGIFSASRFPISDWQSYRTATYGSQAPTITMAGNNSTSCSANTVGTINVQGTNYMFHNPAAIRSNGPYACRDFFTQSGSTMQTTDFLGTFNMNCTNGSITVTQNNCGNQILPTACPVANGTGVNAGWVGQDSAYQGTYCKANACKPGYTLNPLTNSCSCEFIDSSSGFNYGTINNKGQCTFAGCPQGAFPSANASVKSRQFTCKWENPHPVTSASVSGVGRSLSFSWTPSGDYSTAGYVIVGSLNVQGLANGPPACPSALDVQNIPTFEYGLASISPFWTFISPLIYGQSYSTPAVLQAGASFDIAICSIGKNGSAVPYWLGNVLVAPAPPTNIVERSSDAETATLEWSASPNAASYLISIVPGTDAPKSCSLADVGGYLGYGDSYTFLDVLTPGVTYSAAICAQGINGSVGDPASITFVHNPPSIKNFSYTSALETNNSASISFSWSPNNTPAASYIVSSGPAGTIPSLICAGGVSTTAASSKLTGLTPLTTYAISICPVNSAGAVTSPTTFLATTASTGTVLRIANHTQRYNIFSAAGSPNTATNVSIIVEQGVFVYSNWTGAPAMQVGTFPAGSNITIINNGSIIGAGGQGGAGGVPSFQNSPGGMGGTGIKIDSPTNNQVSIINNGLISGGGGGGAGGSWNSSSQFGGSGGGGCGGGAAGGADALPAALPMAAHNLLVGGSGGPGLGGGVLDGSVPGISGGAGGSCFGGEGSPTGDNLILGGIAGVAIDASNGAKYSSTFEASASFNYPPFTHKRQTTLPFTYTGVGNICGTDYRAAIAEQSASLNYQAWNRSLDPVGVEYWCLQSNTLLPVASFTSTQITSSSAVVSWTPVASGQSASATGYKLVIAKGTAAPTCLMSGDYEAIGTSSYRFSGLLAGTTYTASICATDLAINYSPPVTTTFTTQAQDPSALTTFTYETGVEGPNQSYVVLVLGSSNSPPSYLVNVALGTNTPPGCAGGVKLTQAQIQSNMALYGVAYYFEPPLNTAFAVSICDVNSSGAVSLPVNLEGLSATGVAPPPIKSISYTSSANASNPTAFDVTLTWAPGGNSVASYYLWIQDGSYPANYQPTTNDCQYNSITVPPSTIGNFTGQLTSYTFRNLVSGAKYQYAVCVLDAQYMISTPVSITVIPGSNQMTLASASAPTRTFASIGMYGKPNNAFTMTIPNFISNSFDGGFTNPTGITLDGTGNLFVSDSAREVKLNVAGATLGAIGLVGNTGTGPCTAGQVASGWCSGAQFNWGWNEGTYYSNRSSAYDSKNDAIYIADTASNRITKVKASTGAYIGAIGMTTGVSSSANGTAPPCPSAGPTNGWCTGGKFTASFSDGGFNGPLAVAVDSSRDLLYVSDQANRIMKFQASTGVFIGAIGRLVSSAGTGTAKCPVSGVATSWCVGGTFDSFTTGGGLQTGSWSPTVIDGSFYNAGALAVDATNNILYVADSGNHRIVKVNAATGATLAALGNTSVVSTVCPASGNGWCVGGNYSSGTGDGMFNSPQGLAVDPAHNALYVADTMNARIVNIVLNTGQIIGAIGWSGISTKSCVSYNIAWGWCTGGSFAPGPAYYEFNQPTGLAIDPVSNILYVADSANFRIVQIAASTGLTTGATGYGQFPAGKWDSTGKNYFASNLDNTFNNPGQIAIDHGADVFYVADQTNHRIAKMQISTGALIGYIGRSIWSYGTCPSGGVAASGWCTGGGFISGSDNGMFNNPTGIALDKTKDILYVSDATNSRIVKIKASTGAYLSSFPMSAPGSFALAGALALDASHDALFVVSGASVAKFTASSGQSLGSIGGIITASTGTCPHSGVAPGWCTGGTFSDNSSEGAPPIFDGMLSHPMGLALNQQDDALYISDFGSGRIVKVRASTGAFVGALGTSTSPAICTGWCKGTQFSGFSADGVSRPLSLALDTAQDALYVGDQYRVIKVKASTGVVVGEIGYSTGGSGPSGACPKNQIFTNWNPTSYGCTWGEFNAPGGFGPWLQLAVDPVGGYLYISDFSEGRIQRTQE